MLKQTITYKDFNDEEQTEDFYFNLSKDELAKLAMIEEMDINASFKKIVASGDPKLILSTFEELILLSYGQRSGDGRRFMKSQAIIDDFKSTGAYGEFFMKLVTDANFASHFVNALVPTDVASKQPSTFQRPQPQDHKPSQVSTVNLPAETVLPQNPIPVYQRPPEEGRPVHEQNAGVVQEWPDPQG